MEVPCGRTHKSLGRHNVDGVWSSVKNMAASSVSVTVEQMGIFNYLWKEKVKQAEILGELKAHYVEQKLSGAQMHEWCE